MVLSIAKAELRNLFYSPVAWFLAIAFLVQCGWYYTSALYPIAKWSDAMAELSTGQKDFGPYPLTALFFLAQNSTFTIALQNLYLFVPLLTMGLLSREVTNGTIKLLYSSPVKLRQVVIGKYLAIMVYNLLLVSITGIFLVTAVFNIQSVDYGMLLSATLGFYLLTCAYAAIGLFMSSLTSYQILSAIGTFTVIFILSRIGGLWQKIDFVRDLTYFLFLSGRTERMLRGLITSKDVIYFAMVVYMFLGFTLIRLRGGREAKPWYVKVMRSAVVVVSALMIGYVCSRPQFTLYWDTTAGNKNTIHERTQKIIGEMSDDQLEVTLYTNLLGEENTYGFPEARNSYLTNLWEQYVRFKPDIKFRYVYYYYYDKSIDNGKLYNLVPNKNNDVMAKEIAKGYKVNVAHFMPPAEMKKTIDLEPEGHRLVMQLKYKGRTEFLRTYNSPQEFPGGVDFVWPNEQNMAAALKRLVYPEGIPKILYTAGNLERDIHKVGEREYRFATIHKAKRDAPVNLGFDVDTITLDKRDIPPGTTALVVADPKTELSALTQQKIRDYLGKGGNMMLIGEPGKQQVLNPILRHLGVELMDGNLVEPTFDEMPQMVKPLYTGVSAGMSEEPLMLKVRGDVKKTYRYDTAKLLMPGVAALSFTDSNGFTRKPLLATEGTKTWVKKGRLVTDSAEVVYSPQEGDIKGSFPTGLQLTRQVGKRQQRIAIFSDADFVSTKRILGGEALNRTVYHWASEEEYPIYTPHPDPKDNKLIVTAPTVKLLNIVYVWVLPALVLIAGTVVLIRRKRK